MQSITKAYCFKWCASVGIISVIIYLLMEQFFAIWWFVFIAPVFAMILLLISSCFASIIFGIIRRNQFEYSYLPCMINVAVVLVIISQPGISHNKRYPKGKVNLCEQKSRNVKGSQKLYLDYYCVFGGGATATDAVAVYLTDFKNFRVFLGVYHEGDGWILARINGDRIDVENIQKTEITADPGTPTANIDNTNMWGVQYKMNIEKKNYSLSDLKRKRVFE